MLGVKLIVALGHSDCGAIDSAIEVVTNGKTYPASKYGAIGEVIDDLLPPVESPAPDERHVARCVTANAISQADDLAGRDPVTKPAIAAGKLRVVAAVYNLASGAVSVVR